MFEASIKESAKVESKNPVRRGESHGTLDTPMKNAPFGSRKVPNSVEEPLNEEEEINKERINNKH